MDFFLTMRTRGVRTTKEILRKKEETGKGKERRGTFVGDQ